MYYYNIEILLKSGREITFSKMSYEDVEFLEKRFEDGNQPILKLRIAEGEKLCKIDMKEVSAIISKKIISYIPPSKEDNDDLPF